MISGASFYANEAPPLAELHLSAHNSLSPKGFVTFIGLTCVAVLVPLMAVLGSIILWALLPFILAMIAGIWWALKRSWSDKSVTEALTIWTDRIMLIHRPGRGPVQSWEANTYWVSAHLHAKRGIHRHYITLTGGAESREVELGSFLTEEERRELFPILQNTLETAASSAIPL